MKKKTYKQIISIIFFIMGLTMILYPSAKRWYYDWKQEALMKEYLQGMENIRVIDENHEPERGEEDQDIQREEGVFKPQPEEIRKSYEKYPVEGILKIDKIDFIMPVLKGASPENLKLSLSSIDNGNKPWNDRNYPITGHRMRKFGRHFNRLDEMEIEDEIVFIDNDDINYIYKVVSIKVVDQTELSVLDNTDESEITLITCHPITVNHPRTRLIVRGQLSSKILN